MAALEMYRKSAIGMRLTETLDDMVLSGAVTPELAIRVVLQFDQSMTHALEHQVKSTATIKPELELEWRREEAEFVRKLVAESECNFSLPAAAQSGEAIDDGEDLRSSLGHQDRLA